MDYWKLLTEGPLHANEAEAAADLRNDSNNRLLRCVIRVLFFFLPTSVLNCPCYIRIVLHLHHRMTSYRISHTRIEGPICISNADGSRHIQALTLHGLKAIPWLALFKRSVYVCSFCS